MLRVNAIVSSQKRSVKVKQSHTLITQVWAWVRKSPPTYIRGEGGGGSGQRPRWQGTVKKLKVEPRWCDCGVGFRDIPTADFGLTVDFGGLNLLSRLPHPPLSPASSHVHLDLLYKNKPPPPSGISMNLEQPSAMLALYGDGTNIRPPGQFWGLPCIFVCLL